MSKRKLGVLLGGAYALGLGMLVVGALVVLPAFPRAHSAIRRFPDDARRTARIAQVAVHAGTMGLKALPVVIESQSSGRSGMRLTRLEGSSSCGSSVIRIQNILPTLSPASVVVIGDEG